jgi:hypothetical protein
MTYIMTLREWQQFAFPYSQIIVQASTTDGLDGITSSSIGMCYGFTKFKNNPDVFSAENINKEMLLLCAFNTETDQRRRGTTSLNRTQFAKTLSHNGFQNLPIENGKYFTELPKYKFVISPEGNGIDCHRHYEALMAKCIPIVEDSYLVRAKYGNAPILYTRDYSEITQEYLDNKYAEMLDQCWDFSHLFLSHWSPEEQMLIQFRGNYWCEKLAGKLWYREQCQMHTQIYLDGKHKMCVQGLGMGKMYL